MELKPEEVAQVAQEKARYRHLIDRIRTRTPGPVRSGLSIACIGNAGGADNVVHGRPAGGFLLRYAGRTIVVDPGDNSLRYLVGLGLHPYDITDVLASHAHSDHVGDLVPVIAAAVRLALDQESDSCIATSPSLADYSSGTSTRFGYTLPAFAWKARVFVLYPEDVEVTRFDGVPVHAQTAAQIHPDIWVSAAEARHGQVMATGFVFDTPVGRIGYTSDTEYFARLAGYYQGVDVLWMNMNALAVESITDRSLATSTNVAPIHNHLGYVGVCRLIEEVRPSTAIVSHLGAQLLDQREEIQALLRARFENQRLNIYCPANGDEFFFADRLSETPVCARFVP